MKDRLEIFQQARKNWIEYLDNLPATGERYEFVDFVLEEAFKYGAREGWMRCGTYHLDIDFEGRFEEEDELNKRWPVKTFTLPSD